MILTSDNPRTEDSHQILADILSGISTDVEIMVEADRSLAIENAIEQASNDDLVLIAGKGHEDYQILGTKKIYFDDREEVKKNLARRIK